MKKAVFAAILMMLPSPHAIADSCDDLIAAVEGAMADPALTPPQKSYLESLLQSGRAAKAEGNLAACQGAMQSPAPSGRPGQGSDCEKTPDTV